MFKVLAALVIAALVAVGAYVYSSQDNEPSSSTAQTATTQNQDQPSSPSAQSKANYIDYSENAIASTDGQKVLFFHAPWCPQCRALDTDIKASPIPEGVTFIKVDYDSMQELRQKYGVTLQTTFVKVDDQGALIQKYVAYDEPTLDSVIENLL